MPSLETNGSNGQSAFQFYNVIDGKLRTSKDNHQVIDPRTEEPLWDAPIASSKDLDDAVEAANRAFKTWRKSTVAERQKAVHDVANVILDNLDILTEVQMRETGKSSSGSPLLCIDLHLCQETVTLEDEVQYEDDTVRIIATHAPIGVLGAISPWNFPLILSTVKIVSALATGNCCIIKPSPFTPYSLLKFCELSQSVLPPGVFQAVNGGADLGEQMTLHPGIHHISFTGT
ncbi:hypothetical protein PC116_g32063, partial [Phytophthora cactorum]